MYCGLKLPFLVKSIINVSSHIQACLINFSKVKGEYHDLYIEIYNVCNILVTNLVINAER